MKNVILFIALSLVLGSCGLNTSDYYFKLEDFQERKVYKFVCEEDSTRTIYAEMYSDVDEQLLTTINYNYQQKKTIEFVEKYTEEGAILVSYVGYNPADENAMKNEHEILEDKVMMWSVTDKPFSYHIKSSPASGYTHEMEHSRTYITRAHIEAMGEKHEVINFKDVMSFSDSPEIFVSNKYYAEGLGMIAIDYEEFGNQYVLILEEILTGEEWDKMIAH